MIVGKLTLDGQHRIRRYIHSYEAHSLYIGWGMCKVTDTARATDTSLVKELGREVATVSVSGDELTMSISNKAIVDQDVLEVGIFIEAAGGYMLYRGLLCKDNTVVTPIPASRHLFAGDILEISIVFDLATGAFV